MIVPHPLPEQPVPITLQLTPVFEVPLTLALNCCVWPSATFAEVGEIVMPTCSVTVTEALADLFRSATDVAVTVTNGGKGAWEGAVYRPPDVMLPHVVPAQPDPLRLQVTEVLDDPVTVALNCC